MDFSLVIAELTSCHWPRGWDAQWRTTPTLAPQQAGRPDRPGDTGVICFCQKPRNSLPAPPVRPKAGVRSSASSGRDVLSLWLPASAEEGHFSEDLWKNSAVRQVPWLPPQPVPGSAQRAKVSRPVRGFPCAVSTTAYSRTPTLRGGRTTLDGRTCFSVCWDQTFRFYIWFEYWIVNGLDLSLSHDIWCQWIKR